MLRTDRNPTTTNQRWCYRATHRYRSHGDQSTLTSSCHSHWSRSGAHQAILIHAPISRLSANADPISNHSTTTDLDLAFNRPSRLDRVAEAPILRLPVNTGPIVPQPPVLTSRSPLHLVGSCYYTEILISRSSVHMPHSCHLVEYDRPTLGSISHDHNATLARPWIPPTPVPQSPVTLALLRYARIHGPWWHDYQPPLILPYYPRIMLPWQ